MADDSTDWHTRLRSRREAKESTFNDPATSPLSEAAQDTFEGLSWFPIDESARLTARFERLESDRTVSLAASRGPPMQFEHIGQVGVELAGDLTVLSVYRAPGVEPLLLPFRDQTNGDTTWEHGRYVLIEPPASTGSEPAVTEVQVDFNQAYHPLCVYDETVRSAKPPEENELSLPVRAGERL